MLYKFNGSLLDKDLMKDIPTPVSDDMNRALTAPITEKEVRDVVFKMDPEKAPGPDGMTPSTYRQHWDAIKSCLILLSIFSLSKIYWIPRLIKPIYV